VVVAGGAGPGGGVGWGVLVGPVGVVFEAVVASAEGGEVGGVGGSVGVGDGVVEVAVAGGPVAGGEDAGAVAGGGEGGGWAVAAGAVVVDGVVVGGVGDQASPGAGGVVGDVAGVLGADRSVAVEPAGVIAGGGQGVEADGHRDRRV